MFYTEHREHTKYLQQAGLRPGKVCPHLNSKRQCRAVVASHDSVGAAYSERQRGELEHRQHME